MSVVCRNEYDGQFRVFVKGSPEKISELCLKSTVPSDFVPILNFYTNEGFRVIAVATKVLKDMNDDKINACRRDDVEFDLVFLGLVVLENKLKPETNDVIQTLNECKVRTIMATGDNVLTAISIAKQCKIISAEKEVILGDVDVDVQNRQYVKWTSS